MRTKQWLITCVLLFTCFCGLSATAAEQPDNRGREFYLMFPGNYIDGVDPAQQSLFITSQHNASGTVTVAGLAYTSSFSITANQLVTITLPLGAEVQTSDVVESLGSGRCRG